MTLKQQRGTIFITAMISMTLAVLTATGLFALTSQDMYFVHRLEKSNQAQSLAEAGLAKELSALNTTWATSASLGPTTLGNGTYQVTVSTASGRTKVTSTGTVSGVSRVAIAEVTAPVAGLSAFDYAVAAGGDLHIDDGTSYSSGTVTGSIYSTKDIELKGSSSAGYNFVVSANAHSKTQITTEARTSIVGTSDASFSQTVTFPAPDFSYYLAIANANNSGSNVTYYATNKTFASGTIPAAPTGGVIYINGNVTIQGTQNTTAAIIATGTVTINKTGSTYPRVTITAPSPGGAVYPAIVSGGAFTFSTDGDATPNAYLTVNGLLYAGGAFSLQSGNHTAFTVNGSLVGKGDVHFEPTAYTTLTFNYGGISTVPSGFTGGTAGTPMAIESYNS